MPRPARSVSSTDQPEISTLGAILARERTIRGWNIEYMAARAGLSTGLLSQLERGIGNPSFSTLVSLANALEIPVGAFFAGDASDSDLVVHPWSRKRLVLADKGLTYELLVPNLQGTISMLYVEMPDHFSNELVPFKHAGEECSIVLKGSVEIHVGDRIAVLEQGDSIRFGSTIDHWYRTFDDVATIITAMTPPSF